MHEIDTGEHVQQLRAARRRLIALISVTIVAAIAVFGVAIAFIDMQEWMPSPQIQAAVGTPPTRAAPQSAVDVPPPAVTTQSTEKARAKIRKQHSTDSDRRKGLY
jgi:hypothetical protein